MARAPILEPTVNEKPCPGPLCNGKVKPASDFHANPRAFDGLNKECKDCRRHEREARQRRINGLERLCKTLGDELQALTIDMPTSDTKKVWHAFSRLEGEIKSGG